MSSGADPENSEREGRDPHLHPPPNENFTFQDMQQWSNVDVSKTFWKCKKKGGGGGAAPPLNPPMYPWNNPEKVSPKWEFSQIQAKYNCQPIDLYQAKVKQKVLHG